MFRFVLKYQSACSSENDPFFYPLAGLISLDAPKDELSNIQLIHETTHQFQTFSTLFGRFVSSGLNLRSLLIFETAKKLARERGRLFVDFRDWRDELDDESRTCTILNMCISASDGFERVLGYFMGENTLMEPQYLYGHTLGMSLNDSHFLSVRPPKQSHNPKINFRGGEYKISGASLMESFSWYWTEIIKQGLFQKRKVDFYKMKLDISSAWHDKMMFESYFFPLALCLDCFKDDGLRWFPVIVDLALNGPLPEWPEIATYHWGDMEMTDGKPLIKNPTANYKYDWEDVHPGWRFVRILQYLKNNDKRSLVKATFIGNDFASFYPAEVDIDIFVEEISQALGWPFPSQLFDKEVDRLGAITQDDHDFFDNCFRKLYFSHIGFNGMSAFPYHYLYLYQETELYPPPFLMVNGKPLGHGTKYELFAGLQLRAMLTDMFLKPLGNSIMSLDQERLSCPCLDPILSEFCFYKNKDSECSFKKYPLNNCHLRAFIKHHIGIEPEQIEWL